MEDSLSDLINAPRKDTSWSLHSAMQRIEKEENGIVVILRHREGNQELVRRIREHEISKKGDSTEKKQTATELRTFGVGAQILADLGVCKMRVLSSPMIMHGLSGFGLEVVEYVSK
jgi:3,4-dihydroxy 2-butanone 4-phosphate synthase/GTP cyclohydrolase II